MPSSADLTAFFKTYCEQKNQVWVTYLRAAPQATILPTEPMGNKVRYSLGKYLYSKLAIAATYQDLSLNSYNKFRLYKTVDARGSPSRNRRD